MNIASRNIWLVVNFAATIFVSAFLLFQIQPLVSKYILPWFGGTAAVWTTCMLFFQTLLFLGYAYAHLSERFLTPKMQGIVHLALIVLSLVMLRVVPDESWKPTDSYDPAWKILGLLAASIGLPYFVLSSTGPLLQAWFAKTFPGKTPYRLYALSNIGSLLALLSYPFLFERMFAIKDQATIWSIGFVVYAALAGYAAVSLWMIFRDNRLSQIARLLQSEAPLPFRMQMLLRAARFRKSSHRPYQHRPAHRRSSTTPCGSSCRRLHRPRYWRRRTMFPSTSRQCRSCGSFRFRSIC